MKVTDDQLEEIIYHVQGTCGSLEDGINAILDVDCENADEVLTMEQLRYIDDRIFCCDACGWWCDTGEFGEDTDDESRQVCDSCYPME